MKEKIKEILSKIKNNKKLSIISIFVLIALVSGVTYALWSNNYFTSVNTITSGLVSMSYTESSNIITLDKALPMVDDKGMIQEDYFDFSVTSSMTINDGELGGDIDYDIILEVLDPDSGYTSLTNDQMKVYLENRDDNSAVVEPTLVEDLEDSGSNKILLSATHTHNSSKSSITTNYRLRVWIDIDVDASDWTSSTKYEYKLRININGEGNALRSIVTPSTCFEYEENEDNGLTITGYKCGASSTSQTSNDKSYSLTAMPNYVDQDSNNSLLSNEVITDVVIPSSLTIYHSKPKKAVAGDNPTNEDYKACAVFLTGYINELSEGDDGYDDAYQAYFELCKGNEVNGMTFDMLLQEATLIANDQDLEEEEQNFLSLGIFKYEDIDYLRQVSAASNPTDADYQECAKWYTEVYDEYSSDDEEYDDAYQSFLNFCKGGNYNEYWSFEGEIDDINSDAVFYEMVYPGIFDLGVFDTYTIATSASEETFNVTEIGSHAFESEGLTSVVIPDTVTIIGYDAFSENELTNLIIPNSVITIDSNAFKDNKLSSVTFGNSVKTIGSWSFSRNVLRGTLTIPDSVTSIGYAAFYNDYYYFLGNDGNEFTNVIIGDSVETIGDYAFYFNAIDNLTLGNSVESIGEYAFHYDFLKNLVIPDSVKTIGENAFSYNHITSLTLGNSVETIGDNAFEGWGSFTDLVIPDSVKTIGYRAFYNDGISNLTLGSSVETIEEYAFQSNNIAGNLIIPNSVTSIGSSAFSGNQLTGVTIGDSVTSIESSVFSGNKLTSVTIPDSVTSIGGYAFYKNELTSVTIPNSVTSIGNYAFYGNKLTSLTIPNYVTSIGIYAFFDNELTSITIPNSVTSIGNAAFAYNNLTSVIINSGSNLTAETGIGKNAFCIEKSNVYGDSNLNIKIYNNSGKAFDWNNVVKGSSGTTFVTGTVPSFKYDGYTFPAVTITTGSPS